MTRNVRRNIPFVRGFAALACLLGAGLAFGGQPGETVKMGAYSLERASPPKYAVTGVDLSRLSKARFTDLDRVGTGLRWKWGRYLTLFRKEDKLQARLTVAVYGSVKTAEDSALELLNDMSAVFDVPSLKSRSFLALLDSNAPSVERSAPGRN